MGWHRTTTPGGSRRLSLRVLRSRPCRDGTAVHTAPVRQIFDFISAAGMAVGLAVGLAVLLTVGEMVGDVVGLADLRRTP